LRSFRGIDTWAKTDNDSRRTSQYRSTFFCADIGWSFWVVCTGTLSRCWYREKTARNTILVRISILVIFNRQGRLPILGHFSWFLTLFTTRRAFSDIFLSIFWGKKCQISPKMVQHLPKRPRSQIVSKSTEKIWYHGQMWPLYSVEKKLHIFFTELYAWI
jgi:hypothetical protein